MMKKSVYVFICVSYFVSHFQVVKSVQVTTENGIVEGTQFITAEANRTYYAFMGIPYAEPPIGQLRFRPPQPVSNWTGVWNATYEKDICVQPNNLGVMGSENCLFINIFTTEIPTSSNSSLKPVMFFIHGGGWVGGSGNREALGPDYLLNQDVVVVTINYRLGAFGFLSTEDLVLPGNNGLKDQILALRWVQSNVAYFGGDPAKVTIFGESAGSASVSYLVQSPLTAGFKLAPVKEPEHSGAVFTGRSCELLQQGEFNRIPLLVGFNSEEALGLASGLDLLRPILATYDVNPAQLVPADMNVNSNQRTAVGRSIHTHYVGQFGLLATSPAGVIHYGSDTQFTYPIRRYVKFVSDYVNTYYYQFSYEGNLGNPNRGNLNGVGHVEDLSYIFWTGAASNNPSPNDKLTRDRMVKMWTNFAKYRNPTPEADPLLQDVIWSVASTSSNLSYLNINASLDMQTNPHAIDMDFWDKMYNTYGRPPCYTL